MVETMSRSDATRKQEIREFLEKIVEVKVSNGVCNAGISVFHRIFGGVRARFGSLPAKIVGVPRRFVLFPRRFVVVEIIFLVQAKGMEGVLILGKVLQNFYFRASGLSLFSEVKEVII